MIDSYNEHLQFDGDGDGDGEVCYSVLTSDKECYKIFHK